jgi:hypothetical protein
MKLINLDKEELGAVEEFCRKVIKEEIISLQKIDDLGILIETMDKIRNSIMFIEVLQTFEEVKKEQMLENIEKEMKS